MEPVAEHRDAERVRWDFFQSIAPLDRGLIPHDTVKGSQVLEPLFEFSGACGGCGETPVHPPGQPAVRRPDDRRQRDGLLVDLRRQPADHAVDGRRGGPRSGLEQLAVRGQRRVRARDAARARRPDRPGTPAGRAPGARRSAQELAQGHPRRRAGRPRPRSSPSATGSTCCATRSDGSKARQPPTPGTCSRSPATSSAGRLDHRRRWLGVRHRVRWRGPGPVVRSQRQHPGPRHGGLLQHRRPVVEGDAARRGGQVRRRRQGHGQEGPRRDRALVRQRLCRPGLDGRERPADDQGAARGRRLAGTVAGHRLQHLHRPRDRHVEVDEPPEGRGQEWLLAALPLPPVGDRGRQAVQARLVDAVHPDRRLRGDRDALRGPQADGSRSAPPSSPDSPNPTPTSAGTTTSSWPASSGPSRTSIDPIRTSCPRSRATPGTATTREGGTEA